MRAGSAFGLYRRVLRAEVVAVVEVFVRGGLQLRAREDFKAYIVAQINRAR